MTVDNPTQIPAPPPELVQRIGGKLEMGWDRHEELKAGGLQPEEDVLDGGCGLGRDAIPLTTYLTQGTYEGFDPDRRLIEWAQREITSRFPNFRFTHVDIFNSQHNENGTIRPAEVVFPYDDESFDLVLLYSVFTHLPEGFEHYCSEIHRVLRRGGRLWATFFLLNHDSLALLASVDNGTARRLLNQNGPVRTGFATPERMVAMEEAYVRDVLKTGFIIKEVRHGTWADFSDGTQLGLQDGIFAVKL